MRNLIRRNDYINGCNFQRITRNVNKLLSANITVDDFTANDFKLTAGQIRQYKRLGFIKKTGEVFSDKMICIDKLEGLYKKVKVGTYSIIVSNNEILDYLDTLKKERDNYRYEKLTTKIKKLKKEIITDGFTLENFGLKEF